jgi:cellulose synthase/poly-beta-1,6-N-acetylglucosamine synthase-like glycosyltransferase
MISIIITSYKEPKTIGKAIQSILDNNLKEKYEILVTAPDDETLNAAKVYSKKNKRVKLVKDAGNGKPAALNLVVKKAKGDILVLTDGDVYVGENSLNKLLDLFKKSKIGAVSGNPISIDSKDKMLGYWSYVLTNIASERRIKAVESGKRIFCSGYLFAIRKKLFPNLPEELLSEDGYISHNVYEKGYNLDYAKDSFVYIKYPTTFKDWIIQKKRSAGGYNQIRELLKVEIRSFKTESSGAFSLFKYVHNLKELFWLFALFFARLYLWIVIYKDVSLKKKSREEIWKRVETTK